MAAVDAIKGADGDNGRRTPLKLSKISYYAHPTPPA
jgi:hypothetical protein